MPDSTIKCPRCGSSQVHAGNKGFGLGKAAAGGILLGPVGLLGGLIGSKKIMVTCLNCGHKWQAGRQPIVSGNPKSFERTENPKTNSWQNSWVRLISFRL